VTAGRRRLDLVLPDLFDRMGGIARISRSTALALAEVAADRGLDLQVHVLHDEGAARDRRYLPPPARYRAYGGDRRAMASAVLSSAWRPGHAATVFGHAYLAAVASLFPPRARVAVVAHGIELWDAFPRARVDRRLGLARAQQIWSISDYTAERVVAAHRVRPGAIRILPNALDPYWELPATSDGDEGHLLAVTRLSASERYKGIDVILDALAILPEARRPRTFIVGDGDDRERLTARGRELGLAPAVTFLGRVSDEDLARLYAKARAFVLPSTGEGFGLVFLEAMAHARPVIAARAGGAPEVVLDGETGLLVPPEDPASLAAAIERLADDAELRAGLGRAGRARLEAMFLFPRYAQDIAAALAKLVAER